MIHWLLERRSWLKSMFMIIWILESGMQILVLLWWAKWKMCRLKKIRILTVWWKLVWWCSEKDGLVHYCNKLGPLSSLDVGISRDSMEIMVVEGSPDPLGLNP